MRPAERMAVFGSSPCFSFTTTSHPSSLCHSRCLRFHQDFPGLPFLYLFSHPLTLFSFRFLFSFFFPFLRLIVPTMTGAHLGLQFEADSVPLAPPVPTITFIPVSSTQHRNLGDSGPRPRTQAPTPSAEPRAAPVHPPLPAPPPQFTRQPPELPFPPPQAPAPVRLFADQEPAIPPVAEVRGDKKPTLPPRIPGFKASALDSGELPLLHRRSGENSALSLHSPLFVRGQGLLQLACTHRYSPIVSELKAPVDHSALRHM
jgi:hypothetical protein